VGATISLHDILDSLLVWGTFLATTAIAVLSLKIGFRLGRTDQRPKREQEAQVRTMAGAAVGLLTFTLVFTFWIASSHFNQAREAVLDEAGAIGTTYMRADLLPEPYRMEIAIFFVSMLTFDWLALNREISIRRIRERKKYVVVCGLGRWPREKRPGIRFLTNSSAVR
jgi:hypothetical protein